MNRGAILVALLTGVLAAGSSPEAAVRKWSAEVGVNGGFNKLDGDSEIQNTTVAGVRIGLSVLPALQVEVTLDTTSSESTLPAFSGSDFSQDYTGLRLIGSFLATEDVKVNPYIVAGGGLLKTEFDRGGSRPLLDDETTYGEIGVGVRYKIWKDLNARGEIVIRHYRTLEVTHADAQFTAGISFFLFGSKK